MTGGSRASRVQPVVDLPPPRLLREARRTRGRGHAPRSTSSCRTVKRCAWQLREVEDVADEPLEAIGLGGDDVERASNLLRLADDPLADRLHVTADRRQRRAQLVRDGHQERPLQLLGLRELVDHPPEAPGEERDLVASLGLRDLDVVPARGDVVRRAGQREDGLGEPPREPPEEDPAERDADREREREAPDSSPSHCSRSSVVGLRDDEPAERLRPADELHRLCGREQRPRRRPAA